ncbi:SpaA isopeptide-forming pilin-related protein [Clostridium perfringens]|uniref:SpaA isopeptide-forming pilin-related protein n=15 Tax=Clostridium perfringens TaxID=1502 RepID=UPI003AF56A52
MTKKLLSLFAVFTMILGILPNNIALASENNTYVAYVDEGKYNDYLFSIYVRPENSDIRGEVAYCFNANLKGPNEKGNDNLLYTKVDGTADEFAKSVKNPRYEWYWINKKEKLKECILRVIYNGFPLNKSNFKGNLSDGQFRRVTQRAIWYYTDKIDASSDKLGGPLNKDELDVFNKLINANTTLPNNFKLDLYLSNNGNFQDLLGSSFYEKTVKKNVLFSKVALGKTTELSGAKFKLVKGDNAAGQEIVATWESSQDLKELTLLEGTYTLVETKPPIGYKFALPITFRVTSDNKVKVRNIEKTPPYKISWIEVNDSTIKMEDERDKNVPLPPNPTKIKLNAKKLLIGENLKDNEFEFEIKEGNTVVSTGKNKSDGTIDFSEITYTSSGNHEYTIKEVIGDTSGITYDTNIYKVNVNVTDDGEGTLSANINYENNIIPIFKNIYNSEKDVNFSKTEINKSEELPGAELKVVRGEGADGDVVQKWTSTDVQKTIKLEEGTYTMVETQAPNGYEVAENIIFRVTHDGKVEIKGNDGNWTDVANSTIHMEDKVKLTEKDVNFSKTEINKSEELPGAELKVVRGEGADGDVVQKWTSTDVQKTIKLEEGTYTMVETQAPNGYEVAENIIFRVTHDGKVEIKGNDGNWTDVANSTIHMEDKVKLTEKDVNFSKTEINKSEELPGAELKVVRGEGADGDVVQKWTSTDVQKTIKLEEGTYTMVETQAPNGYEIAENIIFRVTHDGKVEIKGNDGNWTDVANSTIHMEDKVKLTEKDVNFSKTEINKSEELPGAELKVVRGEGADGDVVQKWTSTDVQKTIKLEEGTYTMVETQAPNGYEIAENIIFRVTHDGKVEIKGNDGNWTDVANSTIHMEDKVKLTEKDVNFSKTEINKSEELPGAELKVVRGEGADGDVVQKWTSTDVQKTIKLEEGTYTMVETQAPNGYEVAENIIFRVTHDGKVEIKGNDGNWTDVANSTIHMEDKVKLTEKDVNFSKTEINKSEELPGAELKVVRGEGADGDVVQKWTSTDVQKTIKLEEGTYTMVETQAPNGYEIAENIIFRVTHDGKVEIKGNDGNWTDVANSTIHMEDKVKLKMPDTGSNFLLVYITSGLIITITMLFIFFKKNRKYI